jgi:hypothetical protein
MFGKLRFVGAAMTAPVVTTDVDFGNDGWRPELMVPAVCRPLVRQS